MSGTKPKVKRKPESLDGSDLYAAEHIMDKKTKDGKELYLVKWVGWSHNWNTWEPKENITSIDLLKEFEENYKNGVNLKALYNRGSSSSYMLSNPLKRRGRGRPAGARNKNNSHKRQKVSEVVTDSDNQSTVERKDRLKARSEKRNSIETIDYVKPSSISTRRLSRTNSQELNSQSNSVSNSRRSSVASIPGRRSRRNSSITSTSANCSSFPPQIPIDMNKAERTPTKSIEVRRGMPDPSVIVDNTDTVSSDCEQSVSSPTIVPKVNNEYSDCESSSPSFDSQSEATISSNKICDNKNRNINSDFLNNINLTPHVILERLPKIVFKRLISRDETNIESNNNTYEISFKSPLNEDKSPLIEDNSPVIEDNSPVIEDKSPVIPDKSLVIEDKSSVIEDKSPVIMDKSPVIEDKSPVIVDESPVIVDESPVIVDKSPVIADEIPVIVDESPVIMDEIPVIVDESPVIMDEIPVIMDESPVIMDESPVIVDEIPVTVDESPVIADNSPLIMDNIPVIVDKSSVISDKSLVIEDKSPVIAKNSLEIADNSLVIADNSPEIVDNVSDNIDTLESSNIELISVENVLIDEKVDESQQTISEKVIQNEKSVEKEVNEVLVEEKVIESEAMDSIDENVDNKDEKPAEDVVVEDQNIVVDDSNEESMEEIDISQPMDTDIETDVVPKNKSVDSEKESSESAIEDRVIDDIIDSNTSEITITAQKAVENNKSYIDLELTFNEDIMLENVESNDNLNDKNDKYINIIAQYSPVSEDELVSHSLESTDAQNDKDLESTQTSDNREKVLNFSLHLNTSQSNSNSEINTSFDSNKDKSESDSCEQTLNRSEQPLNMSRKILSSSEVMKDGKECETNTDIEAIKDSDFIDIVSEEEQYTDSQDSQLSEAHSTSQPKTKWTPQSDLIEDKLEEQIKNSRTYALRIESDSENTLLPAAPSVTLNTTQGLSSNTTTTLSSIQSPIKLRTNSIETPLHIDVTQPQTSTKSNDELQTTSAIIVDVILSPSADASNVETHVSPNHINTDKTPEKGSPIHSTSPKIVEPVPVPTVMPFNASPRPSTPLLPPPSTIPKTPESSVADASNWPLLSQTNPPSYPPARPPIGPYNQKVARIPPFNDSCVYRQVIQRQPIVVNEPMRMTSLPSHIPSSHQQVIQRLPPVHARHPYLPHPQFMQRMPPSYSDIMSTNSRQTSAQHFSPSIQPIPHSRPEYSLSNRPLMPLNDMRMRSGIDANVQQLAPHTRHPSYPPHFTSQQMRPMSVPLSQQQITYNIRSQRPANPFDIRQTGLALGTTIPQQFASHLQQRLREYPSIPSSPQIPYRFPPSDRMPSNIPISSHSIRPPLSTEFQKKIVVEPKQTEVRDKLKQTNVGTNFGGFNQRRTDPKDLDAYFQKIAYNENMTNKELEVEEILEGCFRREDIGINNSRRNSPSVITSHKSNPYNLSNTSFSESSSESSSDMQILQRLLSQTSDQFSGERPAFGRNNANKSEKQSEIRPHSTSSSSSSTTLKKDILTEAMQEIQLCVVFDEKEMDDFNDNSEENIQLTITDDSQTQESCDNSTPEEGQVYYIYADENAGQISSEELDEMIKNGGFQVVEDTQEAQINEQQKDDSNKETANEMDLNDDIVIEIDDKSLQEVQNSGKTDDTNEEIEVQLLVINNDKSNESNDSINVQISDNNDSNSVNIEVVEEVNNTEEGMVWNLVVDETDSQSNVIPIEVQSTDNSIIDSNKDSENSKSNDIQQNDNNSNNQTEIVESVVSTLVSLSELSVGMDENLKSMESKDDSVDVEVEEVSELQEPTQYVSMPTFCFDENSEQKSKPTEEVVEEEVEEEEEYIEIEKLLDNESIHENNDSINENVEKEAEKEPLIDKSVVNMETEDTVKEITNSITTEEPITVTDNSSRNSKSVNIEESVNKSVQHPFVSSSVEDCQPKSPLSSPSDSESDKRVAQQIMDVNKDDFMPNSPLSSSESGAELRVPTTTICISGTNDSNDGLNKETIVDKAIDTNDKEVPQSQSSHQNNHLIDKELNLTKNDENSGKKRKKKLELSKTPPKKKMTEDEMSEFLHLLRSRRNGFDQGWTPKEIIGINSLNNTLVFLVKWTNDKQTIVLSEVANLKCPQMVIRFYEKHINWDSDID